MKNTNGGVLIFVGIVADFFTQSFYSKGVTVNKDYS